MFNEALLDDEAALAGVDGLLRRLAEAGARVRRESRTAGEAMLSFDRDSRPRAVVVAGADSRLLRAVLEPSCPVPFVAWPGPGLPGWAGSLDLVVVLAQTSGDIAASTAVSEATRRGCVLLVTCSPHSAISEHAMGRDSTLLPVQTDDALAAAVVTLQAMHLAGLGPETEAEPVATALDDEAVACSPHVDLARNPAKELAIALADVNPVVWGGSVLAARAARRVAEALRRASGRAALAADADHLLPVLSAVPPRDVFADPFDVDESALRPALVMLDDGSQDAVIREERGRLEAEADRAGVRVHVLSSDHGSEMARYASLLARGSYAAAYLGVGRGT